MGRPTRAEAVQIAQRRKDAVDLRIAGVDLVAIGKQLAADPALNAKGISYPRGYGLELYEAGEDPPDDDTLSTLVSNDIGRALKERKAQAQESVEDYRNLHVARLERLFFMAYKVANSSEGDTNAIDRAVRVLDRQAKLLGLDMPVKTEVTFTDDELDAEIAAVLAQLESSGEAPPVGEGESAATPQ